jgi:hypothetical protein
MAPAPVEVRDGDYTSGWDKRERTPPITTAGDSHEVWSYIDSRIESMASYQSVDA